MPNRLADAASPYLLQHQDNPVDWWEWGSDAFAEAAVRDVPVFLSVGYSACHWCHVMAHESFEDDETAAFLNEHFVSVKVDREERPDVDRIYMDAVTSTTGHGGWPMTVFLTPDAKPFYAGTYFPKDRRQGVSSFMEVLAAISEAWSAGRDELVGRSDQITQLIGRPANSSAILPSEGSLEFAVDAIAASFDATFGGLGGRRSSRNRRRSSICCDSPFSGPAATAPRPPSRWCRPRLITWHGAVSTTTSTVVSPATRSMSSGWCLTSRRCSTTTRCLRASSCGPSRSPGMRG